jgi:hypothetical protein
MNLINVIDPNIRDRDQMFQPAMANQLIPGESKPGETGQAQWETHTPKQNVIEWEGDGASCPLLDPGKIRLPSGDLLLLDDILHPLRVESPVPKAGTRKSNRLEDAEGDHGDDEDRQRSQEAVLDGAVNIAILDAAVEIKTDDDQNRHDEREYA